MATEPELAIFMVGLIAGIIVGSSITEILFYLYWKREFYPLWEYYQEYKLEERKRNEVFK